MSTDLYEAAVREYLARKLRDRGHHFTRDDVRNVRFAVGEGWCGTDVTPGDPDFASITYELRQPLPLFSRDTTKRRWTPESEHVEFVSPAALVLEVLSIYHDLLAGQVDEIVARFLPD